MNHTPDLNGGPAWGLLADGVLALHAGVVIFVLGGLVAIIAGNLRGWRWVNRWGFRLLHLATIAVVVAQAWLGALCPLTLLEAWLRAQGGEAGYPGSFVAHWVAELLYWDAPAWVFVLAYSAFGLAVILAWRRWPPRRDPSRLASNTGLP